MTHSHALKSETLLLNRLEQKGQQAAADAMKVDVSMISHMKDPEKVKVNFASLCRLLDTLGLKIVPRDYRCFDPEKIDHVLAMAKLYVANLSADKLEWEE